MVVGDIPAALQEHENPAVAARGRGRILRLRLDAHSAYRRLAETTLGFPRPLGAPSFIAMKQARFRKAELALAKRSQKLAEYQRQLVTPERLSGTITDYIEWRAFAYWVRLIVETDGRVSTTMKASLEAHCPGLVSHAAAPQEGRALWVRLISWIDDRMFSYAKAEGWSHALGYYAARDPRSEQIENYWRHCDNAWKRDRPAAFPTFEEWRHAAAGVAQHR